MLRIRLESIFFGKQWHIFGRKVFLLRPGKDRDSGEKNLTVVSRHNFLNWDPRQCFFLYGFKVCCNYLFQFLGYSYNGFNLGRIRIRVVSFGPELK